MLGTLWLAEDTATASHSAVSPKAATEGEETEEALCAGAAEAVEGAEAEPD